MKTSSASSGVLATLQLGVVIPYFCMISIDMYSWTLRSRTAPTAGIAARRLHTWEAKRLTVNMAMRPVNLLYRKRYDIWFDMLTSSAILHHEREYCYISSDNNKTVYMIRGLRDEAQEFETWTKFCAGAFSYKDNPPPSTYFARHYLNDPDRQGPSWVRVAVFVGESGKEEIVASVRVFFRRISRGSSANEIPVAGIGEVCTDPTHRRRGLSKELLKDAFDLISEAGLEYSMLHAAPAFIPYYQSVGYHSITSNWKSIQVNQCKKSDPKFSIRKARFPSDTNSLKPLHQVFSENRFSGCVIRSTEYWNNYVSVELKDSLFVCSSNGEGNADSSELLGCLSVRSRGKTEAGIPKFQLREFSVKLGCPSYFEVFILLLDRALASVYSSECFPSRLSAPAFILDEICQDEHAPHYLDINSRADEDDSGWMFRSHIVQVDITDFLETLGKPHCLWPSDSF